MVPDASSRATSRITGHLLVYYCYIGSVVEFGILGPLHVTVAGRSLGIGGARTRTLLALTLANANRVLSADLLADQVWPDLAVDRAAANLQVRLSELRRALRSVDEAGRLETRPPGYRLRVAMTSSMSLRFDALAAAGRDALMGGDPEGAVAPLERPWLCGVAWRWPTLTTERSPPPSRPDWRSSRLGGSSCGIDALLATGVIRRRSGSSRR